MSDGHGSKDGLGREIGLTTATVIVIANMIGSGIFTTSGFMMGELGHPGIVMACWVLGGLFALTGALCYGELGAMIPRAGGEYAYLREAFGPLPAFLSGWISLIVGFSAPIAAAAIAFSVYFLGGEGMKPWLTLDIGHHALVTFSSASVVACSVILVLSLIHLHSLKLGAGTQNLLTALKILFVATFIIGGLAFGAGNTDHFSQTIADFQLTGEGLAVSLVFVLFAYSGWNAAAYLGGEIRNPGRNLPLSLAIGTLLVSGLYLLINIVYIYALPPEHMSGVLDIGNAAATALFGDEIGTLFSLGIALGLLSVISAMIMAGPRVYFAMARDGVFFRQCGEVHRTHRTPAWAIAFQGILATIIILTTSYDALLIYIGFTLSISSSGAVLGLMYLRHKQPQRQRAYRTLAYPWTPLIFIAGNGWIIGYVLYSRPSVALYGLLTIMAGILLYYLFAGRTVKSDMDTETS
ncbi:APC family permease [Ectothiorhodospira shaposhnikovii]|uniref:APC family permease n=1 Tax=Ectothiorhodospira shaposhnikovii TaxID=1054 RepID=UPI00399F8B3D